MKYIDQLIERYPCLDVCKKDIEDAAKAIIKSYENGGKLLIAGNGGSCADSDHISGELLKSFVKKRTPSVEFLSALFDIVGYSGALVWEIVEGCICGFGV